MHYLFENSDMLNVPMECFIFDTAKETFPVKPHWHYFAEMIYMLEGQAEIHSGDKSYIVCEGEMMILHPSTVHSIYSAADTPLKYSVMKFDIGRFSHTPSYVPKFRSIFKYAERNGAKVHFSAEESARMDCEYIFTKAAEEAIGRNYGKELIVEAQIYRILMEIVRLWHDEGLSVDNDTVPADDGGIEGVTDYIDSVMSEGMKITDIAKHLGMSYSYFAKKFTALYGMSCKEYIELQRIYKAEEFLIFTDYDLNYISQETGFSDCSHLIKSFKKYRGITPKQFRLKRKT